MRSVQERLETYRRKGRIRKIWKNIVTALAGAVVFCTVYALILPAITLETDTFCGMEEHEHGAECYEAVTVIQKQQICELEEKEAHVHTEECYGIQTKEVLVEEVIEVPVEVPVEAPVSVEVPAESEEISESSAESSEPAGEPEAEGETEPEAEPVTQTITETVTVTRTEIVEEKVLICEKDETEGHTHGEMCYEEIEVPGEPNFVCTKTEHSHSKICYSDFNADVETEAQWQKTFEQVIFTGDWIEDTIAIAQTQLGYTESVRNYQVTENGDIKGYTRYGDWYGNRYGDWCAMFVSFCLNYAEVEDFPLEAGCENWMNALKEKEVWQEAEGDCIPERGQIVFFNRDELSDADHVGIVTEVLTDDDGSITITTIEGNESNAVNQKEYAADDDTIMGYGILPRSKQDETIEEEIQQELPEHLAAIAEAIEALPSKEEAEALEDKKEVTAQALRSFVIYEELSEEEKEQIENKEKLLQLSWLWESKVPRSEQGIDVYQVNSYDRDAAAAETFLLFGESADTYGVDWLRFDNWSAIVAEAQEDGTLVVDEVITERGVDKSSYAPETENGFVLLMWHGEEAVRELDIEAGDRVNVPFDYVLISEYTGESIGTVIFADPAEDTVSEEPTEETVGEEPAGVIEVQLSGLIRVEHGDSLEHTYQIQLQQVTDQAGQTAVEDGVLLTAEAKKGAEDTEIQFSFNLSFDKNKIEGYPTEFYYKVTQTTNVNDWSTDYDEAVYVILVTALQSEEVTEIKISNVWKDGQELTGEPQIVFTNEQLYEMTLMQKFEGGTKALDKRFVFEVLLANGEEGLTETYKAACKVRNEETEEKVIEEISFEDGKAEVSLAVDESITIYGLPYDTTWSMKETNAEGYVVHYQVGEQEKVYASEIPAAALTENIEVIYTNSLPYQLPKTGGSGTKFFITGGMGMMCIAGCLLYNHKKKEKG